MRHIEPYSDNWYIFERNYQCDPATTNNSIQLYSINLLDGFTDSAVLAELYQRQLATINSTDLHYKILRRVIPKSEMTPKELFEEFRFTMHHALQLYESSDRKVQIIFPLRFVEAFKLFTNSESVETSAFIRGALMNLTEDIYFLMCLISDFMVDITLGKIDLFANNSSQYDWLALLFVRVAYLAAQRDTIDEAKALWLISDGMRLNSLKI